MRKKFDELSLRERVLVSVASVVITYVAWYGIFYDYLLGTDEEITQKLQGIKEQINSLGGQIDSLSALIGRNPTATLYNQVKELKKNNQVLDSKIAEGTKKLVSPTEMAKILREVIEKMSNLTVLNMESLSAAPLFASKNLENDGKAHTIQVFRHDFKMEIAGGFFQILNFLKAVEKKQLNVIWDEVTYEVQKYPKAKVTILLHTLSFEEGWIGV